MAEDIGGICREYVDEDAHKFADMSEDEAAAALADGAKQRLRQRGWGDGAADFGVDVDDIVRERLRWHRARN